MFGVSAGQKLREANAQQLFNREVDDFNLWLNEVEGHLASENLGTVSGCVGVGE